jgi:transposase
LWGAPWIHGELLKLGFELAAIAEAVTRPTMRFVELKRPDQVDLQALHRIRDQMVGNRTRLICQMRAFCLEYGVAIRQGAGLFKLELPRIIAEDSNDLTPTMRRLLQELFDDPKTLESRIAVITREIESLAARDEKARRLMTMPEIGPLRRFLRLPAMGSNLRRRVTWRLGLALSLSNIPRAAAIIDRDHLLIRSRPLPRRTEFSEATSANRAIIYPPSDRHILVRMPRPGGDMGP